MKLNPHFTLEEHIFWSLNHFDVVRWGEHGKPDEYDLVAEEIARNCWLAKDVEELKHVIRNALSDFCDPLTVPDIDSLDPVAADIWNLRNAYPAN